MTTFLRNIRVKIHISNTNEIDKRSVTQVFDAKLTHKYCDDTSLIIPNIMSEPGSRQV